MGQRAEWLSKASLRVFFSGKENKSSAPHLAREGARPNIQARGVEAPEPMIAISRIPETSPPANPPQAADAAPNKSAWDRSGWRHRGRAMMPCACSRLPT